MGSRLDALTLFQLESNHIEGIDEVRPGEVEALIKLLGSPYLKVSDLAAYVSACQPGARLRDKKSIPDVCVGEYVAPESGVYLMALLRNLLVDANAKIISPWLAHCRYEMLHPFTDGNGRSGRALWLWMHRGNAPLGFLHTFYYETLENQR